ncbi:hypothetical protein SARC_06460 [Sphaeroforma arctica JP610]|uniref:AAA+ ATPase domain-containing protein n=1 Tax=Sphaeroforma arctica JP610 TaxID=667725 RepID=A0A0L0FWK3_9EUKA|nr:hypothetical protein SARC_06460 [Sphaeroforma arctica JP610]KNC81215.1 hypothetical protein SARC_06460 [Sphaeroforma arctica JP610]|eukprot:XP_014155117.1 hypothetical protein SARC_06460 [Sphaeroforma arctica JP610]
MSAASVIKPSVELAENLPSGKRKRASTRNMVKGKAKCRKDEKVDSTGEDMNKSERTVSKKKVAGKSKNAGKETKFSTKRKKNLTTETNSRTLLSLWAPPTIVVTETVEEVTAEDTRNAKKPTQDAHSPIRTRIRTGAIVNCSKTPALDGAINIDSDDDVIFVADVGGKENHDTQKPNAQKAAENAPIDVDAIPAMFLTKKQKQQRAMKASQRQLQKELEERRRTDERFRQTMHASQAEGVVDINMALGRKALQQNSVIVEKLKYEKGDIIVSNDTPVLRPAQFPTNSHIRQCSECAASKEPNPDESTAFCRTSAMQVPQLHSYCSLALPEGMDRWPRRDRTVTVIPCQYNQITTGRFLKAERCKDTNQHHVDHPQPRRKINYDQAVAAVAQAYDCPIQRVKHLFRTVKKMNAHIEVSDSQTDTSKDVNQHNIWAHIFRPTRVGCIVGTSNNRNAQYLRAWLKEWNDPQMGKPIPKSPKKPKRKKARRNLIEDTPEPEDILEEDFVFGPELEFAPDMFYYNADEIKSKRNRKESFINDGEDPGAWSDDSFNEWNKPSLTSDRLGEVTLHTVTVLSGPSGSGKTASVYACAQELGMQVIEINASMRRTGKTVMDVCKEATQSRVLYQQTGSVADGSILGDISSIVQKDTKRKLKHAIILIKDVDVVFDNEDKGFWDTVLALAKSSRRPIVMTLTPNHHTGTVRDLLPFQMRYLPCHYNSPTVKDLGLYCQAICASFGVSASPRQVQNLVRTSNRDIRRAINTLQFWFQPTRHNVLPGTQKHTTETDSPHNVPEQVPYIGKMNAKVEVDLCESSPEVVVDSGEGGRKDKDQNKGGKVYIFSKAKLKSKSKSRSVKNLKKITFTFGVKAPTDDNCRSSVDNAMAADSTAEEDAAQNETLVQDSAQQFEYGKDGFAERLTSLKCRQSQDLFAPDDDIWRTMCRDFHSEHNSPRPFWKSLYTVLDTAAESVSSNPAVQCKGIQRDTTLDDLCAMMDCVSECDTLVTPEGLRHPWMHTILDYDIDNCASGTSEGSNSGSSAIDPTAGSAVNLWVEPERVEELREHVDSEMMIDSALIQCAKWTYSRVTHSKTLGNSEKTEDFLVSKTVDSLKDHRNEVLECLNIVGADCYRLDRAVLTSEYECALRSMGLVDLLDQNNKERQSRRWTPHLGKLGLSLCQMVTIAKPRFAIPDDIDFMDSTINDTDAMEENMEIDSSAREGGSIQEDSPQNDVTSPVHEYTNSDENSTAHKGVSSRGDIQEGAASEDVPSTDHGGVQGEDSTRPVDTRMDVSLPKGSGSEVDAKTRDDASTPGNLITHEIANTDNEIPAK